MSVEESVHTLYRFFDAQQRLLYVGRTTNPGRRWREHEKGKDWFTDVATVTREVFSSAEDVDRAERAAIATENPAHNIALTRRPRAARATTRRDIPPSDGSVGKRWAAARVEPTTDCVGEPTECECPACHDKRLCDFEDLRSKYQWHPDIDAEIDHVEAAYFGGKELFDWYYDLFDIQMLARGRLFEESKTHPLPAHAEFDGCIARVDCPFCFATHRHFLTSGASLDAPLEASCERIAGGKYVVSDDYFQVIDDLFGWGEISAKRAAA